MTTKLGIMVTYLEEILTIKSFNTLIKGATRLHDKQRQNIFTTTMPMATKLGRMIPYLDELLPIKAHDPLNT